MITKEQKYRLHVFLTVSAVLLIISLAIFIIPILRERGTLYTINFESVSVGGLEKGAVVKYQGVRIGSTEKIQVNPLDLKSILVTIRIQNDFRVKTDMKATLRITGITGLQYIELFGGTNESPEIAPEGNIPTAPGLGEKAENIVSNIDKAVKGINKVLGTRNQENLEEFVKNLNETARVLSEVFNFRRVNLEELLVQLDEASANLEKSTRELNQFAVNLNRSLPAERMERLGKAIDETMENLRKRSSDNELGLLIRNADSGMQRITSSIEELKEEMSSTLNALRETLKNLSRFTRRLDEDPNILVRKSKRRRSRQ